MAKFKDLNENMQDYEESKKIGENLKALRKMKGWTQTDVANKLNIPLTTYSTYELGYNRQHAHLIKQLAELYNVTTDRILNYESKQFEPNTIILVDENNIREIIKLNDIKFNLAKKILKDIDESNM